MKLEEDQGHEQWLLINCFPLDAAESLSAVVAENT